MVLNSSGPVHSRNETERWLLFNRDMMGPAESDVSGGSPRRPITFFPWFRSASSCTFLRIPSDREQSQPVRAREDRAEVRPEPGLGAPAPIVAGDHLRAGVPLGELQRQRGQPRDGRLGTLLQRNQPRRDERALQQPQLPARILRAGRSAAQRVFPSGGRREAEPRPPVWLRPRLPAAPLHLGGPRSGPLCLPSRRLLTTPSRRVSTFQRLKLNHAYLASRRLGRTNSCCNDGDALLPQIYLRTLCECWWQHFISIFWDHPTCLCLAFPVLNRSSPMMNVKEAEKEKKCQSVKYCDTFSLYLIPFHWRKEGTWGPLWLFTIYLHPQLLYIYYYLLFFPQAVVQYFFTLRGQGHNNNDLPCLLRRFFFYCYLEFFFFNSLEFSFVFTVVKDFCSTIFEWRMLWG